MNARQEAKLSMYRTIASLSTTTTPYWSNTVAVAPILTTYQSQISGIIAAIVSLQGETGQSTVPISASKLALRRDMESKAASIASKLYAYAIDKNNLQLAEKVKPWRKKSAWAKLKDNITNIIAANVYDWAIVISPAADLVPYGIVLDVPANPPDPEEYGTINIFWQSVEAYERVLVVPEATIGIRKGKNQELDLYFNKIDRILSKMDDVIYEMKFSEFLTPCYLEWKAIRTIFDPPTQHTKIRGVVTAAVTGLPIKDAKITAIAQSNSSIESIEVFSDEKGNYTAYTPKFKFAYTVIASKPGMAEQQITDIYVKLGKPTNLNFSMEPIQAE